MQASLEESELISYDFAEIGAKVCEDFNGKMKLNDFHGDQIEKSAPSDEEVEHEYEDDDDDDEFSFACLGADGSPISADDVFQDGQIRPVFPLFDQSLLFASDSVPLKDDLPRRPPVKKVFFETEETEGAAAGPYCTWTGKAVEASTEACKKSNSTGFSKFFRFRDLVHRSNSDGRDAFVFLNNGSTTETSSKRDDKSVASSEKKTAGEVKAKANSAGGKATATKGKKRETASLSPHEMHYVRNRAWREEDRRRSYLPYRPELVGFFTNVHGGLSRNVHPF